MKVRNYEKKELIILFIILLFICEFTVFITLFTMKFNKYLKVNGIVIKDNLVLVMVSKSERKVIYSNKVLFYNNKRYKYKIVEDRGIIMKKGKNNYYQLVLKFSFKEKVPNDTLEFVFIKGRIRLIEIFKIIWEGG